MNKSFCSLLLALLALAWPALASDTVRALIVDGQSNHDWKATTATLKAELLSSGIFHVDVATAPPAGADPAQWKSFAPHFADYGVVILNYYGQDWPAPVLKDLEDYVSWGGGLAAFHAGGSSFESDATYNQMIGMGWHKKGFGPALALDKVGSPVRTAAGAGMDSGHGAMVPFSVDTRANDHPIMQGFPAHWMHLRDELYHSLRGPAEHLEILATAHSPITGMEEPMAWTVTFGKGRVFYTALGHDVTAMRCFGFQNLMVRGLEWAANAPITELVKPFPEEAKANTDPNVAINDGYIAIKLPITKGVPLHNPTAIAVGPDKKLYVTNYTGEILRLEDSTGSGLEDTAVLVANVRDEGKNYPFDNAKNYPGVPQGPGDRYPTALTFKGDDLYVATTQEIRVYHIENGKAVGSRTFATGWPYTMHYFDWTFGLRFGPDGWLYANLTTDYINPHPAPDPKGLRGSMIRISPDGRTFERYAYGLRFSYGIAFNEAGDLFCTDNEGGDNPAEKFNYITQGGNYGHHPKLPTGPKIPPLIWITPHLSTDGLEFNRSTNDFGGTAGDAFIALWGPDGKFDKGGVTRVHVTKKGDGTYEAVEHPFSTGPAKTVNLCFGPQGDLYLARFGREGGQHTPYPIPEGDIYRVIYAPGYDLAKTSGPSETGNPLEGILTGNPAHGKEIATQRQCLSCHSVDGSCSKLGPDWKGLWTSFGREGILKKVADPASSMSSGYETYQITTSDNQTAMGRIIGSDEEKVTLFMPGNVQRSFQRKDIKELKLVPVSMMPPNLTAGLSNAEINDLLTYIRSLTAGDLSPVLHVKLGGPATTDANGTKWWPDIAYKPGYYGYIGGNVYEASAMSNPLLKTTRYGDFQYRFDTDNGDYDVTLVTGEPYFHAPGQRVFSVIANGETAIQNLDPESEGGFGKPVTRAFRVHVSDGKLELDFKGKTNSPVVAAIEVKPSHDSKN